MSVMSAVRIQLRLKPGSLHRFRDSSKAAECHRGGMNSVIRKGPQITGLDEEKRLYMGK